MSCRSHCRRSPACSPSTAGTRRGLAASTTCRSSARTATTRTTCSRWAWAPISPPRSWRAGFWCGQSPASRTSRTSTSVSRGSRVAARPRASVASTPREPEGRPPPREAKQAGPPQARPDRVVRMLRPSRLTALFLVVIALGTLSLPNAAGLAEQRGEVALALMLRKLATVGTVMHVTAHPDDENNSLLAMESQAEGLRVVLVTATRGNGGQNEIGPEIFEALGVLRTEELLAAHRFDGAEQFFARAVDFGYSFSIDESFEKWGKDEIVG